MAINKKTVWAIGIVAVLVVVAIVVYPKLVAEAPVDANVAKMTRIDNLNNYRYCEIFLIGGNAVTKHLVGSVFNTTELNNKADPHDSCPEAMWDKVDAEALKKEYHVLGVFKNGPRYWMYDWIESPIGPVRQFNDLQVRWINTVAIPADFGKGAFYKDIIVHRKSKQGYAKGQTVFILDAPDGMTWVMQASSRIVDKNLSYDDLKTLDQKLKLPSGWKYRVKVLDQDLGVSAIDGLAHIMQDDLEDTYNSCFEANGQKNCTFKP
jgi:hypothetical protein